MSVLFGQRAAVTWPPEQLVPVRNGTTGGMVQVTPDSALHHSAVWACLRLRADLVSTMPVEVFRMVDGLEVNTPLPLVLRLPGGGTCRMLEWLYSTQQDLDAAGNTFGVITRRDSFGLPACIELQDRSTVVVVIRNRQLAGYRIAGKMYPPEDIWHEKQHTVSGSFVGLSAIAHSAWTISEYLSAQQFAIAWFGGGAVPSGHLKNVAKTLTDGQAEGAKTKFRNAVAQREVFVTGSDWEYTMITGENSTAALLDTKRYSISDIGRFFGVPGDLIDASESLGGGKITYANITQRNLEFLILHLQPAISRREEALSLLLPAPRYVRLNTEVLLRMDLQALVSIMQTQINSRTLTPDEARQSQGRPPLRPDQIDQFNTLFPAKAATPQPKEGVPA